MVNTGQDWLAAGGIVALLAFWFLGLTMSKRYQRLRQKAYQKS